MKGKKISWGHVVLCIWPFDETSMSCRSFVGSVGLSEFGGDISAQCENQVKFSRGEKKSELKYEIGS